VVVALGIQTYFLVSNPKADIISLIHIRLYTQKLAVQRLCSSYVFDGIDECSEATSPSLSVG
jgi:hypothetical protein